jgi:hypothetical protein
VRTGLNTLLTALCVGIDDYLGPRRHGGRPPNTGPARFDPLTLLAGGLVLAVLQTEVGWTRSDTGRWRLRVHKRALRDSTIATLIRGLLQPTRRRPYAAPHAAWGRAPDGRRPCR